jgi:GNAT superfamily N-acetyltransferase
MQSVNSVDYSLEIEQQTIWIKNQNTTIAYCRYSNDGDIEYIYVQPMYRLMGFGRRLVQEVQRITGKIGSPHAPVSPMGQRFFAALKKYS